MQLSLENKPTATDDGSWLGLGRSEPVINGAGVIIEKGKLYGLLEGEWKQEEEADLVP